MKETLIYVFKLVAWSIFIMFLGLLASGVSALFMIGWELMR